MNSFGSSSCYFFCMRCLFDRCRTKWLQTPIVILLMICCSACQWFEAFWHWNNISVYPGKILSLWKQETGMGVGLSVGVLACSSHSPIPLGLTQALTVHGGLNLGSLSPRNIESSSFGLIQSDLYKPLYRDSEAEGGLPVMNMNVCIVELAVYTWLSSNFDDPNQEQDQSLMKFRFVSQT